MKFVVTTNRRNTGTGKQISEVHEDCWRARLDHGHLLIDRNASDLAAIYAPESWLSVTSEEETKD